MAKRRVEIIRQQEIFRKFFFHITEAQLRHQLYNGQMSQELTRLVFARGDSVAILIHDPVADTIVLTEQFRYPTYRADQSDDDGWLLEIHAGTIEPGEDPEATVRREVNEEIGYNLQEIIHLTTFYLSPGGTSERIILYYTRVRPTDKTSKGGGLISEGEDIRVLMMKVNDALKKVETGEIQDAKSIIALQWLQFQRRAK